MDFFRPGQTTQKGNTSSSGPGGQSSPSNTGSTKKPGNGALNIKGGVGQSLFCGLFVIFATNFFAKKLKM